MNQRNVAPVNDVADPGRRWRWWHVAAFGLAVNSVSGLLTGNRRQDRAFYEAMKLPSYAPPGWLFPLAWAINNAFTLWGNLRLLNQRPGAPGRRPMLTLQAASWVLYATFSFVYFRKRSPILAAVWTVADWMLTVATVAIAAKRQQADIVGSQATKFAWLTLAVPVAVFQARHNPDPVFATQPVAAGGDARTPEVWPEPVTKARA